MITFEGFDINTNQLFRFDHLKQVIELLCKEIKEEKDKTNILERSNEEKDRVLNEMDEKIITMNTKMEKRFKNIEVELGKNTVAIKKGLNEGKQIGKDEEKDENKNKDSLISIGQNKTETAKSKENIYVKQEEFVIPSYIKEQQNIDIKENVKTELNKTQIMKDDYNLKEDVSSKTNKPEDNNIKATTSCDEEIVQKTFESNISKDKDKESKDASNDNLLQKNHMELLSSLFKKIKNIENQMQTLEDNGKSLSKETRNLQFADNKISSKVKENNDDLTNQIALLNNKIGELFDKQIKTDNTLDDIKVKVTDFNVFDLFKDSGNGTVDAAKAMIVTLETKVFKKFSLIDEKLKDVLNDIQKLKTDSANTRNSLEMNIQTTTFHQEEIRELRKSMDETNSGRDNQLNEIRKTIQLNYAELLELITRNKSNIEDQLNEKINNIESSIINLEPSKNQPSLSQEPLDDNKSNFGLTSEEKKQLKDIKKKLFDLETSYRLKMSSFDLNGFAQSIKDLQNEISTKITTIDLKDLYDLHDLNNEAIQNLKELIYSFRDENKKVQLDYSSLIKKIESLTGLVAILQSIPKGIESKGPVIDIADYIDQKRFIESTQALYKELEKLRRDDEEQKRLMGDLMIQIKTFATNENVKVYQETINQTVNELKLLLGKKYVDKNELSKAVKSLELEIKFIAENGKKADGENWLLAKKPLNGYQCASCESHIANLANQRNEYVPWNKYPTRDEKIAYRMGGGFSHMLQMMNQEALKNIDQKEFTSDNDEMALKKIRLISDFNSQEKPKLPRIRNRQTIDLINDDVLNYSDEKIATCDNKTQLRVLVSPKVVKILKRPKKIKNDSQLTNIIEIK